MNRIAQCVIFSLVWIIPLLAKAASPVFLIIPVQKAPPIIYSGQIVNVSYQVTNNTPYPLNGNGLINLPQGLVQTVAPGTCTAPFNLAPRTSCLLQLQINADVLTSNLIGGPVVCNTVINPIYCSKPSAGNEINVIKSPNPPPKKLAILTISPTVLNFITGGPAQVITLNNTSDVTAENLQLVIPGYSSITLDLAHTTCGMSLPANSSCQYSFLPGNQVEINTPITISGSNVTSSITLNINVVDLFLNLVTVGYYSVGIQSVPLSYLSSDGGVSWSLPTTLPPILGSSTTNMLSSVNCNSSGVRCVAVGQYNDGSRSAPLSYTSTDSGMSWALSSTQPAAVGTGNNNLQDVTCDSTGVKCVAVGYAIVGINTPLSYTSVDGGVNWILSTTLPPAQGGVASYAISVACDNTGIKCAAIGYYNNGTRLIPSSYTSTDGGANWSVSANMPPPSSTGNNVMTGIACSTTGLKCTAIGYSIASPYIPLSYTSTNGGVSWSSSTILRPTPSSGPLALNSIACDNNGLKCAAVGYYRNGGNNIPLSYFSTDGGVTWTQSTTLPASQSTGPNTLFSITCDKAGFKCVAVGSYNDGSRLAPLSFTSTDVGINWVLSTTLPPAQGTSNNFLNGVSGG
ncbi:MAG: hypothetical protein P4L79_01530 [Legionella sp.]|uniref:hypothetical protein n=1 Tax=Legionella sp. TaxID=459 RepID=UPI00283F4287|nr:hypothetical protein [Legionella sp.]